MKFNTKLLHGGFGPEKTTGSTLTPIYQVSAFAQESAEQLEKVFNNKAPGYAYTRISNPTVAAFENRMNTLEKGVGAVACSSGMAAVTMSLLNILEAGDEIICGAGLFGGTIDLFGDLAAFGIKTKFVKHVTKEEIAPIINSKTKAVFAELIGNPNLEIVDIKSVADLAHENGAVFILDSTTATPYLINPFDYGADIVVHSATKFIGGHGAALGGVIVDAGKFDWNSDKFPGLSQPCDSYHGINFAKDVGAAAYITRIRTNLLRDTGATLSPFHSFLFIQGLETLSLRVERHTENALKVVEFLKQHPQVERVNHPSLPDSKYYDLYQQYFPKGAGSIFTFEIKGGEQEAKRFIDSLEIFSLLANVADAKSLVIHPASTTHSQLNAEELKACDISPNTVRLSIGIEHIDDIIEDLTQAFTKL